ncbi:hypothetical protein ACF0H5_003888 [Mactra antiquata]
MLERKKSQRSQLDAAAYYLLANTVNRLRQRYCVTAYSSHFLPNQTNIHFRVNFHHVRVSNLVFTPMLSFSN